MVSCQSTTREKSSLSARNAYEYHLKNWSDIQDHLPRLYEAAKGNCMEIGVRSGVSTSALLAGIEAHGGDLYSFDLNHCDVFHGHPQWSFIQADSIAEADTVKRIIPSELEVLFVDGDHTYEGALADLLNYGLRAKHIFVHDSDAPDFPGVRKAVDEFAKHAKRQVTYHSGSYGMAEIQ
jgi:hypothetical protein